MIIYHEVEFWEKVYIAAIQAGCSTWEAEARANKAVSHRRIATKRLIKEATNDV